MGDDGFGAQLIVRPVAPQLTALTLADATEPLWGGGVQAIGMSDSCTRMVLLYKGL